MKKKTFCLIAFMSLLVSLWATSIDSVLEKAKEQSPVYQGYVRSYENSEILEQMKDLKGSDPEISISGNLNYAKDGISADITSFKLSFPSDKDDYSLILETSSSLKYSDNKISLGSSSVSATLPSFGDDYKVVLGTSVSEISFNKEKPVSLTPTASIAKDYVFSSYEDTRSEIKEMISDIQRKNGFITNVMNFETTLINTLVSIMESQTRLESLETSYKRMLKSYENDKYLGTIEEGSLTDISQKLKLDSSKVSLDSQRKSFEKAKEDFAHQYGFDFEKITEVRDANLEFEINEEGNSTVLIAALNLESARQDLEAAKGYKDTLALSTSASGLINTNSVVKSNRVDLNASVKYTSTSKNFNVSTTIKESLGRDLKGDSISAIPSITVAGAWSSKPVQTEEKELTLKTLSNAVLEKENAYNNALYSYKTSAQTLKNDIESYKTKVEQNRLQTQYDKAVLDYQTTLFEKGLTSQQVVDDARTTYEGDLQTALIYKLQALSLENRIKTIEL